MPSANAFQSKQLNGELYDCLVFTYINYKPYPERWDYAKCEFSVSYHTK